MRYTGEERDEMMQITEALSTAPVVAVPDDFANRVIRRIPQTTRISPRMRRSSPLAFHSPQRGRLAILLAVALLLIGMAAVNWLGHSAAPVRLTAEWVLSSQFLLFSGWIAVSRRSLFPGD